MRTLKTLSALFAIAFVLGSSAYGADSKPAEETVPAPKLTRFDLDFPGGTAGDLVAAIEKASGRPLNLVIPNQFSEIKLPPLKMRSVDAAQLFDALSKTGSNGYHPDLDASGKLINIVYRIETTGRPSDESVWYLNANLADRNLDDRYCRFFLLEPFLDHGLTVDDITTAIQTAWKMMGDTNGSQLSYHPETKLLIAVCNPKHLEAIQGALEALKAYRQPSGSPDSADKSIGSKKS